MLVRTTSCDGGLRVDLSCDTCGDSYEVAGVPHFNARLLWERARRDGWIVQPVGPASRHGCPECVADAEQDLTDSAA